MTPSIIEFKIEYSQPMELEKLTLGMMALAAQYERYFRHKHPQAQEFESDLLVEKISEGSVILHLIAAAQPALQGMDNILIFKQFVEYMTAQVSQLTQRFGRLSDSSPKELESLSHTFRTIATDPKGKLEIAALEYEEITGKREVRAKLVVKTSDAVIGLENVEAQLREISVKDGARYEKVLMYLYQTNIDSAKTDRPTNEKAIIEEISKSPLRLIYASELAGEKIKDAWRGADPYRLGFIVDVDVQMAKGKPRAYRIMDVHEIFPFEDDDSDKS